MGDNKAAIRHFDEVLRVDSNLGVAYLTRSSRTRTQSGIHPLPRAAHPRTQPHARWCEGTGALSSLPSRPARVVRTRARHAGRGACKHHERMYDDAIADYDRSPHPR
jgi:hypothetical protein